jgi:hypothetical protein
MNGSHRNVSTVDQLLKAVGDSSLRSIEVQQDLNEVPTIALATGQNLAGSDPSIAPSIGGNDVYFPRLDVTAANLLRRDETHTSDGADSLQFESVKRWDGPIIEHCAAVGIGDQAQILYRVVGREPDAIAPFGKTETYYRTYNHVRVE